MVLYDFDAGAGYAAKLGDDLVRECLSGICIEFSACVPGCLPGLDDFLRVEVDDLTIAF